MSPSQRLVLKRLDIKKNKGMKQFICICLIEESIFISIHVSYKQQQKHSFKYNLCGSGEESVLPPVNVEKTFVTKNLLGT